jgi:hypothetical protein
MSLFNQPLGINLTDHDPLIDSVFSSSFDNGESFPPPGSEFMITETGIFMITEIASNFMITE